MNDTAFGATILACLVCMAMAVYTELTQEPERLRAARTQATVAAAQAGKAPERVAAASAPAPTR